MSKSLAVAVQVCLILLYCSCLTRELDAQPGQANVKAKQVLSKNAKKTESIPANAAKIYWYDSADTPRGRGFWFREAGPQGNVYHIAPDKTVTKYNCVPYGQDPFGGDVWPEDALCTDVFQASNGSIQIRLPRNVTEPTTIIKWRKNKEDDWKPLGEVNVVMADLDVFDESVRSMFRVGRLSYKKLQFDTPTSEIQYWYKRSPGLWHAVSPLSTLVVNKPFDVVERAKGYEIVQTRDAPKPSETLYDLRRKIDLGEQGFWWRERLGYDMFRFHGEIYPLATTSSVTINIAGDLTKFSNAVQANIPESLNEHGAPDEADLRWDFRLTSYDARVADGRVVFIASYKGDIETKQTFGGCHLQWVYPIVFLSFKPSVRKQADGEWYFTPEDLKIEVGFREDSDFSCSFLNISAHDLVVSKLNPDRIRQMIGSALAQLHHPAPVGKIWDQMAGPFAGDGVCFYPGPVSFSFGQATGQISRVEMPINLVISSRAVLAKSCPQRLPSEPAASEYLTPSDAIVVGLRIPYQPLVEQINATPADTGFSVGNVDIEGDMSSMSLSLNVAQPAGIGNVEFKVSPRVDPVSKSMSFDFRPTETTLLNSEPTRTVFVRNLADILTKGIKIDLSGDIARIQSKLSGEHVFKDVKLTTAISSVNPFFYVAGANSLDVYISARFSIRATL